MSTFLFLADFQKLLNLRYLFLSLALIFASNMVAKQADAQTPKSSQQTTTKPAFLILGDSLSSAFGFEQTKGWVSLLDKKLQQSNYKFRVVNASISGETTQGGVQRLPKLLEKHNPQYVIIELGGNDGLRGLSLLQIENNLKTMITYTKNINAITILVGIRLPPNYGQFYTERFYQLYKDLATHNNLALIPFLLEDVVTNGQLMQEDGIHPKADAQSIILRNVWDIVEPILKNNH